MSKIQVFVIDDSDEEEEKPHYSTIIEEEPYEDEEEEPQPIGAKEYSKIQDDDQYGPDVKGWDPYEPNFFHIQ